MKPLALGRGPAAPEDLGEPASAGEVAGTRLAGMVTLAAAAALVAGVTVLQGLWTERWGGRNVAATLKRSAETLEQRFPARFGNWEFERELESDPKELERAGAVGHVSRVFKNVRTKGRVSAFVICATPHDASGHTPDRCYPAAGFEIAETEHRQAVRLADGRKAETLTGTFRKQGQTIRIFWTYSVDGNWVAPQIARIELAGADSVYKLYAIIDETRMTSVQSMQECLDFLGELLPALDKVVAEDGASGPPAGGPTAEPAPPSQEAARG